MDDNIVIAVLLLYLMLHITVIEDDSLSSQVMIMKGWLHPIFYLKKKKKKKEEF